MPREYIPVAIQRIVVERAWGRCEYCQSRADHSSESFAVEHIIALSRGGSSEVEALKLNRPGLINMREVLYLAGKHPPVKSS